MGGGEPIARCFIEAGHDMTGVDSSPALIDLSRRRFSDHAWLVSDMQTLAVGRRFDGLVAWDSLFHLRPADPTAMFEVFRSHASPDQP